MRGGEYTQELFDEVKDHNWFFETEMYYLAKKKGLTIKEIPICWIDNGFSGVNILKTIPYFIKECIRIKFK